MEIYVLDLGPVKWWAGRESNPHSRRRLIYSQRSSPPAQPTHGTVGTRDMPTAEKYTQARGAPSSTRPTGRSVAVGADARGRTENLRFTKRPGRRPHRPASAIPCVNGGSEMPLPPPVSAGVQGLGCHDGLSPRGECVHELQVSFGPCRRADLDRKRPELSALLLSLFADCSLEFTHRLQLSTPAQSGAEWRCQGHAEAWASRTVGKSRLG
jgi:hypothetical protein